MFFFVVGVKMRIPIQFFMGYVIAGSDEYIDGRYNVISGNKTVLFFWLKTEMLNF